MVATAFTTGCGTILTKSQVDVISGFSRANQDYSKLPGSVLRSYEETHFVSYVLAAAPISARNPKRGVEQIQGAVEVAGTIDDRARQLDAALVILDRYRALLVRLSSSDLSDLDGAASDLGSAFDDSVKAYNLLPAGKAKPLPTLGSDIAAGARALGGIWVRNRQVAYLRKFVERADPVISRLASDVEDLMASSIGGALGSDATNVTNVLLECLASCGTRPGSADLALFAETLRKERVAATLAEQVKEASLALARTHKALGAALAPAPSVGEAKAELSVLISQVTGAAKIKAKLDGPSAANCK